MSITIDEVLNEIVFIKSYIDRDTFGRVFYHKEPHQDVAYVDEKWGYYQRNGIEWTYASLDNEHRAWVCEFIKQQITVAALKSENL